MSNEKSRPAKAANLLDENYYQYSAPDPIYEARLTGWLEGFHTRDAEVAQLTADRDRFYEYWRNPGKQLTEVRQRRMLAASEEYWAEFVAEACAGVTR